MKTLALLSVIVAVECGGSHVVGKDRCTTGSCGQSETCDFDGVCRSTCGSNYPGAVCPSGTVCVDWICRPSCATDVPSCPAGSECRATQGPTAPAPACSPVICRDPSACQAGEACVRGLCTATGGPCGVDQSCGSADQLCDQGTCRVRCGPNFPTQCATGTTCNQSNQTAFCN